MSDSFVWFDQPLETMGDIIEEVISLVNLGEKSLAWEFIDDYGTYIERTNPGEDLDGRAIAVQNIGYLAGYYDEETRLRIYAFFETQHPIFGLKIPTPEEAFEEGQKMGEAIKKGLPYP